VTAALFIIGTSHTLQCATAGIDGSKVALFEAELRRVCVEHQIARIAEEMSEAGLEFQGVQCTVAARVAKELRIEHCHVDLEPKERAALSLDDGPMLNIVLHEEFPDGGGIFRKAFDALGDAVRERCWIGRMLAHEVWPTLFVCGADHTDSVEKLWRSLGLPLTVVHRDYDP
jgi:hypothetical protein